MPSILSLITAAAERLLYGAAHSIANLAPADDDLDDRADAWLDGPFASLPMGRS